MSKVIKIVQFGEGRFLRAFADVFFEEVSQSVNDTLKVVMISPRGRKSEGVVKEFREQECRYTVCIQGLRNGKYVEEFRVVNCIENLLDPVREYDRYIHESEDPDLELILSNTTENGIRYDPEDRMNDMPQKSYPAKLTAFLYHRFCTFEGDPNKAPIILASELIDNNGQELKKIIRRYAKEWGWNDGFDEYVDKDCLFCSTLVDRIVPGRIRDKEEDQHLDELNGYRDNLKDVGEVFGVWYIEGPKELENKLPFKKAGLNVHVVPEVAPYKKRKVRILNGAHTGFVLGAYLAGKNIVRECMQDETIHKFMNKLLFDEVIPILPLDKKDCENFAAAVTDRFNNPFVDHQLMSISLNSTSKWKARDLPSLLEYFDKFGTLPKALCMGFAAYIAFYSNDLQRREENCLIGKRPAGNEYSIQDDDWVLDFYWDHRDAEPEALVHDVLKNTKMWDRDLTDIPDLENTVVDSLKMIREQGAENAYLSVL